MPGPVHVHTRVRIREGELDGFLDAAKRFVEVDKTEPGALGCSCFVDRENRTVVWFEIFKDLDGFLAHAEFPGLKALQPEMIPRVEEFERLELYGDVPQEILKALAEQGMQLKVMPEHASFLALAK
jgi:quinol monooxygenase YgiN